MNWFKSLLSRFNDSLGRICAGAGGLLEGLDLTGVADPIKAVFGAKAYQIAVLVLFAVSYLRHHYAAVRVAQLQSQVAALQK